MSNHAASIFGGGHETRLPTQKLYIGGRYVDSKGTDTFETINPTNGSVLAVVQQAVAEDVDEAVRVATEAQKVWAATPPVKRSRILNRAVQLLRERNDELAYLETLDSGRPFRETSEVDIATGADVLEYYAGLAPSLEGRQIPLRETSFVYTRREPLGVIAAIGAWNYPIQIALWKSAPALAAGNAVIFKPSEVTPLTALRLAEIYTEAGLPDGCFNVLNGVGSIVGAALTEHEGVAKVSFTGGTETGKKVMASASASTLKEVTMELGGKSPMIVLEDADLDKAADIAVAANFFSSGQVCTHGTRVFVPRSVLAMFEDKVVERARRLQVGDPLEPSTTVGPLSSFQHRDKVVSYIASGRDEGARLLLGGELLVRSDLSHGAFVVPTIFSDCGDDMAICRDEIMGPVMSILPYDTEEEAITRANATTYGLAAGVVTRDVGRAILIVQRLEAGVCWINTWNEMPVEMPIGGYKQSGVGRENGIETLERYTQVKSVQVELGEFAPVY